MAIITLDRPDISNLKTYKILNNFEYTYFALQWLKDPGNSTQVIDTDDFEIQWGIGNTELVRHLQSLETKKALKITPVEMAITWGQNERTNMSQEEVLSMKKDGLINNTTYVYYALLLNKGAGLTQNVAPDDYSVAPWSIPAATLLTELSNISSKTNDDNTKVITLDLTTVSVVWLI